MRQRRREERASAQTHVKSPTFRMALTPPTDVAYTLMYWAVSELLYVWKERARTKIVASEEDQTTTTTTISPSVTRLADVRHEHPLERVAGVGARRGRQSRGNEAERAPGDLGRAGQIRPRRRTARHGGGDGERILGVWDEAGKGGVARQRGQVLTRLKRRRRSVSSSPEKRRREDTLRRSRPRERRTHVVGGGGVGRRRAGGARRRRRVGVARAVGAREHRRGAVVQRAVGRGLAVGGG